MTSISTSLIGIGDLLILVDCHLLCWTGFPSVGRALWLSLFDGERTGVERPNGRLRLLRRSFERHARERPWRSRLRPAPTGQHFYDVHWRQQYNSTAAAQQEQLVVPCPAAQQLQQQPQQPSALYRAIAGPSPSTPIGLQVQLLGPFPAAASTPTTGGRRSSSNTRKVLLLIQQQCELTAPLLAVVIVAGRLRRQCQLQPLRFSSAEVCLSHQLPDTAAAVFMPTGAAAALWCWGWFANEHNHPIRRQHHGRIAHLKESTQCHNHGHLARRKPLITSRSANNKNKRDLSWESSRPFRV